jgi:cytochrome d ubiquinol oxidase subunit II
VLALVLAGFALRAERPGWAFVLTGIGAVGLVATLFTGLYPRVLVSDPDFANSLTVTGAASAHYALSVITVVAAVVAPVVLLYQAWTYYVLRARLGGEPPAVAPDRWTYA